MGVVFSINKYTEEQARKLAKERSVHWGDISCILRFCTYCSAWINVEDMSGEKTIEGKVHLDICDDCSDRLIAGQEVIEFKDEGIDPDDYCGDCGHPLEDPFDEEYCEKCRPYSEDKGDEEEDND